MVIKSDINIWIYKDKVQRIFASQGEFVMKLTFVH